MRRRWGRTGLALGALVATLLTAGCREDTVQLSFRPAPGQRATYRIDVRAVAVTTIGDEEPRRRVTDSELRAEHRVLESGPEGSRVEVRLRDEGGGPTTVFEVRFDRGGQPTEVQRIEGLPAGALGDLGLSEIFPAAAAAPPDRPLSPGDRWDLDQPVGEPGAGAAARLTGSGRLVALHQAGGRPLADVESTYRTPVLRTAEDTGGRLLLDGSQSTRADVAYDLEDDVVHAVRARTHGRYQVTLLPPPGVHGVPVPGTLVVDVDSTTRRLD